MTERTPFEEAALDYCAPRGIRLSEFLEVWSEADQMAALEWQAKESRKCPNGHDMTESTLKENAYAYRADALRCHACHAVQAAEAQKFSHKVDQSRSMLWRLTKQEATDGRVVDTSGTVPQTQPAVQGDP